MTTSKLDRGKALWDNLAPIVRKAIEEAPKEEREHLWMGVLTGCALTMTESAGRATMKDNVASLVLGIEAAEQALEEIRGERTLN